MGYLEIKILKYKNGRNEEEVIRFYGVGIA